MNFNRLLFWYGLAAVLSTLFWAITGMGWWAPDNSEHHSRDFVIALLHIVGLIAFVLSFVPEEAW